MFGVCPVTLLFNSVCLICCSSGVGVFELTDEGTEVGIGSTGKGFGGLGQPPLFFSSYNKGFIYFTFWCKIMYRFKCAIYI